MTDPTKLVGNLTSVSTDQSDVLGTRSTALLPTKPEGPAIYYLFQNSETTGPFTAQAIRRLLDSGTIDYTTFCSTENGSGWKSISDFPDLSNL